jgi:ferrous iron transport protein B
MSGSLTLALAGNPNAGKTVARSEGTFRRRDIVGRIVDLPGTYSLSAFSPEEVITRDYLLSREPSAVIDVVDATNLERNLYLTAQLLELGIPLILALNVSDSARSLGLRFDTRRLSVLLGGAPIVETVGHRGKGMDELLDACLDLVGVEGARMRLVA